MEVNPVQSASASKSEAHEHPSDSDTNGKSVTSFDLLLATEKMTQAVQLINNTPKKRKKGRPRNDSRREVIGVEDSPARNPRKRKKPVPKAEPAAVEDSSNSMEYVEPVMSWKNGVGELPGCDLKFRVNELGVFEMIQPGESPEVKVKKELVSSTYLAAAQADPNIGQPHAANATQLIANSAVTTVEGTMGHVDVNGGPPPLQYFGGDAIESVATAENGSEISTENSTDSGNVSEVCTFNCAGSSVDNISVPDDNESVSGADNVIENGEQCGSEDGVSNGVGREIEYNFAQDNRNLENGSVSAMHDPHRGVNGISAADLIPGRVGNGESGTKSELDGATPNSKSKPKTKKSSSLASRDKIQSPPGKKSRSTSLTIETNQASSSKGAKNTKNGSANKKIKAPRLTRSSLREDGGASGVKTERKRSFERVLNSRMPHLKRNPRDTPEVPSPLDDGDSHSEKGSSHSVQEHNWQAYLAETQSKAAPLKLFRKPAIPGENPFKKGMMLEAIDPQHQNLFCVASVVETQGFRLRINLVGFSETYDFWVNADSDEVFPCGWCEENGHELEPPPGETNFSWHKYLVEKQKPAADRHFFVISGENPLAESEVRVGMKLEAVDIRNQKLVCVASVSKVIGERFLVHFDSWDAMYDYWTDLTSPYIHPVGWCDRENVVLVTPNTHKNNRTPFTWDKYLRDTKSVAMPGRLFQPLPPVGFKTGMKLECVDKRNPFLIRVATVNAVNDHEITIHFDGWSEIYDYDVYELSPDLHPAGYCGRTGHALQPPPQENRKWTGPCPTFGCIGMGHIKGPKFLTHNTDKNCPYAAHNILREWPLTDRLMAYEKSCGALDRNRAESEEYVPKKKAKITKDDDEEVNVRSKRSREEPLSLEKPAKKPRKAQGESNHALPKLDRFVPNSQVEEHFVEVDQKTLFVAEELQSLSTDQIFGVNYQPIAQGPPPIEKKKRKSGIKEAKDSKPERKPRVRKPVDTNAVKKPRKSRSSKYTAQLNDAKVTELSESLLKATLESAPTSPVGHRTHAKRPRGGSHGDAALSGLIYQRPIEQSRNAIPALNPPRLVLPQYPPLLRFTSPIPIHSIESSRRMAMAGINIPSACSAFDSTIIHRNMTPLTAAAGPLFPAPLSMNIDPEADIPPLPSYIEPLLKIVGDLSPNLVSKWLTQDVKKFVSRIPGCSNVVHRFTEQMIDGEAFLLLNQGDLLEVMGFKMGPAIKLAHVIRLVHNNRI